MEVPKLYPDDLKTWSQFQEFLDKCLAMLCQCEDVLRICSQKELTILDRNVRPKAASDERDRETVLEAIVPCAETLNSLVFRKDVDKAQFIDYLVEKKAIQIFHRLLRQLNHMGLLRDDNVYQASYSLYNLLWNLSDASADFATALAESGCLPLAYENVSLVRVLGTEGTAIPKIHVLIEASLAIIHNVVRRPGKVHFYLDEWKSALLEVVERSKRDVTRLVAIMILSYTAKEHEKWLLDRCGDVVLSITRILIGCEQDERRRALGFSVEELLDVLVVLTVQDSMKRDLLRNDGVALMKRLCSTAHPDETSRATRILCNLVMQEEVREELKSNHDIVKFLEDLHATEDLPEKVKHNVEGALWVLGGQKVNTNRKKATRTRVFSAPMKGAYAGRLLKQEGAQQSSKRAALAPLELKKTMSFTAPAVFISYASENKAMVHKVWNKLEENGVRCWIDQERMEGSSIEAMASGIQQASTVLLCMSSAYKVSHWGKMEAEYAVKLKKTLIPLIVEYRYKPEGWEGFILGDKIYYEFSERHSFEEVFHKLHMALQKSFVMKPLEAVRHGGAKTGH